MTSRSYENELEAFAEVRELLAVKRHFDASNHPTAFRRQNEARIILAHALDIAALLCGNEVLELAYGAAATEDRKDGLHTLADRLRWPALLFAGINPGDRRYSFEALKLECETVSLGDAPKLMAKLPGYRKNVRLLIAKFRANRWDAYLQGAGLSAVARHSALAQAFGQEWDTMSRWASDAIATWGQKAVAEQLAADRYRGAEDVRRFGKSRLEGFEHAISRSGRVFRRAAGYVA